MADPADSRFHGSATTPSANARDASRARLTSPGVRFPPPFLFAAAFLSGLALERWVWRLRLPEALRPTLVIIGWLAIVAGFLLFAWALLTLLRHHTAIVPHHPASRLVESGPYGFSRNPMYVGVTTLYVGLAFLFNLTWPILILPLALVLLFHLVIRREERYLSDAFGDAYAAYCHRVRRWL